MFTDGTHLSLDDEGTPDGSDSLHGVDIDTPNAARVYDYYLGGAQNFASDRRFADEVMSFFPEARDFALNNRSFQQRAVRHVASLGVDQFLDLGSGIPTVGPTHETARSVRPGARVLYVDIEPVATAHTELLLAKQNLTPESGVGVLEGDLRDPAAVLASPAARTVLDTSRPVGVMILGMLHFLTDEDNPAALLAEYLAAFPAGSYLIASHATSDGPIGARVAKAADKYAETKLPGHVRTKAQFAAMLPSELELLEPGITWNALWRPDTKVEHPERSVAYAAVGRTR